MHVFTPLTLKKGIKYYNSRYLKDCENTFKNFNFNFIAKGVGQLISTLSFTEDELVEMEAKLGTDIALFEEKRLKAIEIMDREKKKVREDLAYLRSNKLSLIKTGVYTTESYAEEDNRLDSEHTAFKNAEDISDIAMRETMKDVWKLSELIKDVVPYYGIEKPHKQEQIIRVIFSELYVS